jgi:hypothetical protein
MMSYDSGFTYEQNTDKIIALNGRENVRFRLSETKLTQNDVNLYSKLGDILFRQIEVIYPQEREVFKYVRGKNQGDTIQAVPLPNFPKDEPIPTTIIQGIDPQYLHLRNVFHWDRKILVDFPNADEEEKYNLAKIYHFLHETADTCSSVLESIKYPLQNRIWFNYPEQYRYHFLDNATIIKPSKVAIVLSNNETQCYQYKYEINRGQISKIIDPIGRTTVIE